MAPPIGSSAKFRTSLESNGYLTNTMRRFPARGRLTGWNPPLDGSDGRRPMDGRTEPTADASQKTARNNSIFVVTFWFFWRGVVCQLFYCPRRNPAPFSVVEPQPELPLCSVPNGATAPGYGAAAPCYGARPKKEMYGRSDGGFAAERRRGARRGGAGFVCAPHPAGPLAGGAPPGMGTVRAANKSGTRERGRKTELFCQITERITERCCPLPARSNSSAAAAP